MGPKSLLAALVLSLMLAAATRPTSTYAQSGTALPDMPAARSFVEQVYSDYGNKDWADRSQRQARFYTVDLYHAVLLDQRFHLELTPRIDGDPLCDYQDCGNPGQLTVQSIALTPTSPTSAKAVVSFVIVEAKHTVTLSLVRLQEGWRIADVSTKQVPSLYHTTHPATKP
jgi:hypothetical protein